MQYFLMRTAGAVLMAVVLTACGGGGDGGRGSDSSGIPSVPPVPTDPPDEVPSGSVFAELSNRNAPDTANTGMAYVLLEGQATRTNDGISIDFSSGQIAGGLLAGTNIDSSDFSNPANGEFSRIVRIAGPDLFGAVGLDSDLPAPGTMTNYNEGWVRIAASFEDDNYVLEGDAIFSTTFNGVIDGQFVNLSGTGRLDNPVSNVGNINLNNASISGDNFSGGSVSGTGIFRGLGDSSSTSGTSGTFFGPDADELGGVLVINDNGEDIQVFGAFQAD